MTVAFVSRASRFGDIRPKRLRGSGGFADVYEALDSRDRRLALKVFRRGSIETPKTKERLQREAEILRKIDTRGVARLVDSDLDAEYPWIASEYIDGPNLFEAVQQRGALSLSDAIAITRTLLQTLNDLHQQGISHRDLTPRNVIIGYNGPVIVDFGSARDQLTNRETSGLLSVGTPNFLSPEATEGLPVGPPADIYAVGLILLYMLSGAEGLEPERGASLIPEDLAPVFEAMLARSPNERPTASQAMALLPEATGAVLTGISFDEPELLRLPRRFSPLQIATIALVSIAVGLGGGFLGFSRASNTLTVESLLHQSSRSTNLGMTKQSNLGVYLDSIAIPNEWSISRVRPNDIIPNSVLGTVEAFLVTAPNSNDQIQVSLEILDGQERDEAAKYLQTKEHHVVLNSSVRGMFDQFADDFESKTLPTGCSLSIPDDSKYISTSTYSAMLLVGVSSGCSIGSGAEVNAFVTMFLIPEKSLAVYIRSRTTDASIDVGAMIDSVILQSNSVVIDLPATTPMAMIDLFDSSVMKTDLGDATFESVVVGFKIAPDEALQISAESVQDAQIRAYRIDGDKDGSPYQFIPLGRDWLKDTGDRMLISTGSADQSTIFLEFEQMSPLTYDLELQVIETNPTDLLTAEEFRAGGEVVQAPAGFKFLLPIDDSSSTEETVTVDIAATPIPVAGSWFGNFVGSFDDASALFANPYSDYYNWVEADMAQISVYRSDVANLVFKSDAYNWLNANHLNDCRDIAQYERKWAGRYLQWKVYMGCDVPDAWASVNDNEPRAQYAPVVEFILSSDEGYQELLQGSFVPQDLSGVQAWERIVAALLTIPANA